MNEIAVQVSHDIRSPLAALQMLLSQLGALPDEQRALLRGSVNHIRDIANALLERHRISPISSGDARQPDELLSCQSLVQLVESAVSEIRLKYSAQSEISIEILTDPICQSFFSLVHRTELRRILANLMDNSVDAFNGGGLISVSLTSERGWNYIRVTDNGRGMPKELEGHIGERGATFGKPGGSGLGLWHAMKVLQSWGGKLSIEARPNKQGTCVSVALKSLPAPRWFQSALSIREGAVVVVVDDDPTVHEVWRQRLLGTGCKIEKFTSLKPFELWLKEYGATGADHYLLDHEIPGEKTTGLDVIERHGLARRSVLVTSRHDDTDLQLRCSRSGVRLMPKSMAAQVMLSS